MRTLSISILSLAALFFSITNANADVTVQLANQGIELRYPKNVRLLNVLQDSKKNSDITPYTFASKLFDSAQQASTEQLLASTIARLKLLAENPIYTSQADKLIKQLSQFSYGYRLNVPLELDRIRLNSDLNPLLSGDYELYEVSRPNTVTLFGVLNQSVELEHSASKTVHDYLEQVQPEAKANNSVATIIYPNGQLLETGYAYWNNQFTSIPPGSFIFLGFSASDDLQELENNIIHLLASIKGKK